MAQMVKVLVMYIWEAVAVMIDTIAIMADLVRVILQKPGVIQGNHILLVVEEDPWIGEMFILQTHMDLSAQD